jgi:predicted DNA binding protein
MATVAEFSVPTSAFPFAGLFEAAPEATVELERVVPVGNVLVPYLWVRRVDGDRLRSVVEREAAVGSAAVVDDLGDEFLLRVEWAPDERDFLRAIADAEVSILSATGTADGWTFEVRAESNDRIAAFRSTCRDAGIPAALRTLHSLEPVANGRSVRLTGPQREALLLAYRRGYFDHPRRATLEEIAAELGISRQALAARLRRGHRRLVEDVLDPAAG